MMWRPHRYYLFLALPVSLALLVGSIALYSIQAKDTEEPLISENFSAIEIVTGRIQEFFESLPAASTTSRQETRPATSTNHSIETSSEETGDSSFTQEHTLAAPATEPEPEVTLPDPEPIPQIEPQTLTKEEEIIVARARVRAAVINILCSADSDSPVHSTSGSGVLINEKGTILTNAHVAFPLLLKDYPKKNSVECIVRTGNPARNMYKAELSYISPQWVQANAKELASETPRGTGAHDFAILSLTETINGDPLPATLPYVPIFSLTSQTGDEIIAAAYPAGSLSSKEIRDNLTLISVVTTIKDMFTFNRNTIDVLSLGGGPLAQQGSSGGAVVNTDGRLVGLLVTSSLEEDVAKRDLRAITIGHITRSMKEEQKKTLADYIVSDISKERAKFYDTFVPELRNRLLSAFGIN